MDPTANLNEQLELARRIMESHEADEQGGSGGDLDEGELADASLYLSELILALDEWIRKGCYPTQWRTP